MRLGRNMEELTGSELHDPSIGERGRRGPRQYQPDVLHQAVGCPHTRSDMGGPAPAGLIGRSTDGHSAEPHQLEPSFDHLSNFVGRFKSLQNDVNHSIVSLFEKLAYRARMTVEHDPQRSRFVVSLSDGEAELFYAPFSEDILDLQHTEIPPSGRGQGIGDALVRAALAYARERNLHVIATCPYVRDWLRRHPDERPLDGA